jgi:hypothetical protein
MHYSWHLKPVYLFSVSLSLRTSLYEGYLSLSTTSSFGTWIAINIKLAHYLPWYICWHSAYNHHVHEQETFGSCLAHLGLACGVVISWVRPLPANINACLETPNKLDRSCGCRHNCRRLQIEDGDQVLVRQDVRDPLLAEELLPLAATAPACGAYAPEIEPSCGKKLATEKEKPASEAAWCLLID